MKLLSNKTSTYDLFIFAVIFFALLFQGSYFPSQYLTILMLLSILLLFKIINFKNQINIDNRLFALFLIFILIYIISTIFVSENKYLSILETCKIAVFSMLFISISLMKDKRIFLKGIIWGVLGISILGLLSYLGIIDMAESILNDKGSIRLQSVMQYANVTGALMGVGFFLAYYFISCYVNFKTTIKYYIFSHLFLLNLILTLSRGAILSFIICLILWLFFLKDFKISFYALTNLITAFVCSYLMKYFIIRENTVLAALTFLVLSTASGCIYYLIKIKAKNLNFKKIIIFIIAFLIILMGILLYLKLDRLSRISPFQSTFISRLVYFKDGLGAVKENFLLGIGPGNWTSQQFFYQNAKYFVKYIHNGFLQIALDTGFTGLIIFISIVVLYYKKSIKGIRKAYDKEHITLMIIISYILIHSLIDIDLSFVSVLMILSGMLAFDIYDTPEVKNRINIKTLKNFALALLLLTTGLSIFLLIGQNYYNLGERYFVKSEYNRAVRYYEKSKLFRPYDNNPYIRLSICYEMLSKDKTKSIESLRKARALDIYDPRPLKGLINAGRIYRDYRLVYDSSIELIALNRFDILGYERGLNALFDMYNNKTIDGEEFNRKVNSILDKLNGTNEERDSAAIYMEHNEKLKISDDLMIKLK